MQGVFKKQLGRKQSRGEQQKKREVDVEKKLGVLETAVV